MLKLVDIAQASAYNINTNNANTEITTMTKPKKIDIFIVQIIKGYPFLAYFATTEQYKTCREAAASAKSLFPDQIFKASFKR